MKHYDHKKIETKWQKEWAKAKLYETPDKADKKDNFYLLVEFPYPSGNLHVGHWYAFALPDMLARLLRMQGKNVMYPIGFDAFGLPAENAAIKNKLNPRIWTEQNIEYMKKQIASMGTSFDMSRLLTTIDPEYYKWTQWQFLQFFKKGLAHQKETPVNWCPNDKTVLANEQVIDGKCERCGHEVSQREMLQWNLKITDYADRLIDDLEKLDWPEPIKDAQRNWIGRSEGAEIDFPLEMNIEKAKKYKYVILHGFKSDPDKPKWLWLKSELEKMGHTVIIPALPHSDAPTEKEWVETALNCTDFDENTVLVGSSLGSVAALKVLERLEKPIFRLVTVGGFVSKNFKDNPRPFEKSFTWTFDGDKIRKNVKGITILHDPRDYAVSDTQAQELSDLLKTPITIGTSTEPHFTGDKEPDVLMWLRPTIRVFTTRPDTLFGGTFLVLAPEHPWVKLALQQKTVFQNNDEVQRYIDAAAKKTELERQEGKEKTGVELKGVKAINPASGEKIPLWVSDFAIATFGTGALFGDAHDERDTEFAKKYGIPLKETLEPLVIRTTGSDAFRTHIPPMDRPAIMALVKHWSEDKYLCLRYASGAQGFVGGGIEKGETPEVAATREIGEETGYSDAKFVQSLGTPIHSKFYGRVRKKNVFAHYIPMLFKLCSDARVEISDEEKALQEAIWINGDDVAKFINREDFEIAWQRMRGNTCYSGKGILFDSGEFSGMTSEEAIPAVGSELGRMVKQYRLRDWIVSRQRYWGVPIPIIHCAKCRAVAVPEDQLPVLLPDVEDYLPSGEGKSPLYKVKSFVETTCPQCGGMAERETDTLDTFVDSSWYFLRYTDPHNSEQFADSGKQKNWMPVDLYSGGAEHTTMHVLYSRFWYKALFDLGLVADAEPYTRRINRSIILGPDGQKMSKSRGNVIDPDKEVERLGADTVRMYLAFIGPYNEVGSYPWNPYGVVGVRRFLERLWKAQEWVQKEEVDALQGILHKSIKKVGEDAAAMKFNTAISQLMIFLNALEKEKRIGEEQWKILLRLVAPFAPHMAEELWNEAREKASIHTENWPQFNPKLLIDDEVTIGIQLDGKTRGDVKIKNGASKKDTEAAARAAVADRLEGKTVAKVIVVPNRLVNFVLK